MTVIALHKDAVTVGDRGCSDATTAVLQVYQSGLVWPTLPNHPRSGNRVRWLLVRASTHRVTKERSRRRSKGRPKGRPKRRPKGPKRTHRPRLPPSPLWSVAGPRQAAQGTWGLMHRGLTLTLRCLGSLDHTHAHPDPHQSLALTNVTLSSTYHAPAVPLTCQSQSQPVVCPALPPQPAARRHTTSHVTAGSTDRFTCFIPYSCLLPVSVVLLSCCPGLRHNLCPMRIRVAYIYITSVPQLRASSSSSRRIPNPIPPIETGDSDSCAMRRRQRLHNRLSSTWSLFQL
ncbi:hypothetical protein F4780DRAFT_448628 [Xylariomycetidae sp. FL0641]|nr:hypothetical protein F4780DRAFT_448628 [Xylariomycetidae sp. FL0641]